MNVYIMIIKNLIKYKHKRRGVAVEKEKGKCFEWENGKS